MRRLKAPCGEEIFSGAEPTNQRRSRKLKLSLAYDRARAVEGSTRKSQYLTITFVGTLRAGLSERRESKLKGIGSIAVIDTILHALGGYGVAPTTWLPGLDSQTAEGSSAGGQQGASS